MNPFIIGLDVDEVCADLLTAWLDRYNLAYGDTKVVSDLNQWDMVAQIKPECGEKIYDFLTPDIYDEVLPLPSAIETVEELKSLGRVIFVTTGNPEAKLRWLRRWGFLKPGLSLYDKDFFAAKDKSLIRADVLFDDYVENVESFPGAAYLVPHFHNQTTPCKRPRLSGFGISHAPEAVEYLRILGARQAHSIHQLPPL